MRKIKRIALDFTNQWNNIGTKDLIQIGMYEYAGLYCLCFTLLGFGLDIDFYTVEE